MPDEEEAMLPPDDSPDASQEANLSPEVINTHLVVDLEVDNDD